MQARRIDGIYRRDIPWRAPERRLVVPERPPTPVLITDITLTTAVVSVTETAASVAGPGGEPATSQPVAPPNRRRKPLGIRIRQLVRLPCRRRRATDVDLSEPSKRSQIAASAMAMIAVVIVVATAFLGWQTYRTNVKAKEAYSQPVSQAASDTSASSVSSSAPNEADVPDETKNAYTVAADMPRMLSIPSLGVNARVLRMSVGSDGAIEAPAGIWDTGWYDGSTKPGEAGNAFIDGHVSGPTMPAVFKELKNIRRGAEIRVERGDGTKLRYAVSSVETVKLNEIDMRSVLTGPGGEALTIMTCGGDYLGDYTYDSRVIVVAIRT